MRTRKPAELRVLDDLFHQCDPPPGRMLTAAYAAVGRAHGFEDPSGLELIGDSADEPANTRLHGAASRTRVLTYLMPGRIVEVDLVPMVGGMLRASGIVLNQAGDGVPQGEVVLRCADDQHIAELDENGRYGAADLHSGPLSVVFRPAGTAAPAVADWLVC